MSKVSTADLHRCHRLCLSPPAPSCFLKGKKAGGPLWGWLFLVATETGSPIPSDHQRLVAPQEDREHRKILRPGRPHF